jgi:hypothetical protein
MSDKKQAWMKVHRVYDGRPIVSFEKKEAWDAVQNAYNIVSPTKNLKPASPPPIGTMSYKGMPQKEEIPGREEEGVKEVKAKEEKKAAEDGGGGSAVAEGKISFTEGREQWGRLEMQRQIVRSEWEEMLKMKNETRVNGRSVYNDNEMEVMGFYRLRDVEEPRIIKQQAAVLDKVDENTAPASEKMPKIIRELKVGDNITYGQASGYMGDGGDSRDRGYTVVRKVTKLLGRNKYEVEPEYKGQDPVVFALNTSRTWLKDTNRNRLSVYRINGKSEKDVISEDPYQAAFDSLKRDRAELKKRIAAADKKKAAGKK